MTNIEFSAEETKIITRKIQQYFQNELDQDLGQFGSEFLLEFFAQEIGPYFYNRGLYDARAVLMGKIDDVTDAIYEIEKPTGIDR
jgi:uncharacterized protein (DUF2164 family)